MSNEDNARRAIDRLTKRIVNSEPGTSADKARSRAREIAERTEKKREK